MVVTATLENLVTAVDPGEILVCPDLCSFTQHRVIHKPQVKDPG